MLLKMYVQYSAVVNRLIFVVPGIYAIPGLCPVPFDDPSIVSGYIFRESHPSPSRNQHIGTELSNRK